MSDSQRSRATSRHSEPLRHTAMASTCSSGRRPCAPYPQQQTSHLPHPRVNPSPTSSPALHRQHEATQAARARPTAGAGRGCAAAASPAICRCSCHRLRLRLPLWSLQDTGSLTGHPRLSALESVSSGVLVLMLRCLCVGGQSEGRPAESRPPSAACAHLPLRCLLWVDADRPDLSPGQGVWNQLRRLQHDCRDAGAGRLGHAVHLSAQSALPAPSIRASDTAHRAAAAREIRLDAVAWLHRARPPCACCPC